MVRRATSEGRLPDAHAAEAALEDVFAWVPPFDVAGAAARGPKALNDRVMSERAVARRVEIGSDSGREEVEEQQRGDG